MIAKPKRWRPTPLRPLPKDELRERAKGKLYPSKKP